MLILINCNYSINVDVEIICIVPISFDSKQKKYEECEAKGLIEYVYFSDIKLNISVLMKNKPSSGIYVDKFSGYYLAMHFISDSNSRVTTWNLSAGDIIPVRSSSTSNNSSSLLLFGGITLVQPLSAKNVFVTLYMVDKSTFEYQNKKLLSFGTFYAMIINDSYFQPCNRFANARSFSGFMRSYLNNVTLADVSQFLPGTLLNTI